MSGSGRPETENDLLMTPEDEQAVVEISLPEGGPRSGPVKGPERIEVVDILRGFAIFGILCVNIYGFAGMQLNPQNYGGLDKIVVILVLLLAQAKFYSLFSFLFGWGMWIQMSRAIAKGVNFVPLYIRRMLILLVIGILHGIFIWTGDILTVYAIMGLLLLLLRKKSERTLLIAIALLLLIPIIVNLPGESMDGFRQWYSDITEFLRTVGDQGDAIYGYGTYSEITDHRRQEFVGGQSWFIYWIGNVFAMFLLGFYAGKKGYFDDIKKNIPTFKRMLWIGLVVGMVFAGASVLITVKPEIVGPEWQRWVRIATRTIGAPALMLFYVSAITLLSQKEAWQPRLAPLAPVGRMALSNYLLQSIVLTLIFYGYGLALYGDIGPTVGLALTVIVYLAQIRFSAWWLERYRFGPMEWLWRTLTYGRIQRLRRGKSYQEPRRIPGLSRVRRWLSAIPPLVLLVIVWIGLVVWAYGLIRWNANLSSEKYVDPFSQVAALEDGEVQNGATSPVDEESETAEQGSEIVAFMPEVKPVSFNPGSIVSSGDMQALADTFEIAEAIEHIEALTDLEFAGRLAGSPEGRAAGEYIAAKMVDYGLQPGGYEGTFYQPFPITYTLLLDPPELAVVNSDQSINNGYVLYEDFAPFVSGYAGGGVGSGQVYWVNQCQPEDFHGLDVVGKIVLCQAASGGVENRANSRRALEYGASGLLLLTDPLKRPADFGYRHSEVWVPQAIPVLHIYEDVIADLLEGSGIEPSQIDEDTEPFLLATSADLLVSTSGPEVVEARNVLGILPGRDPDFADEVVVIGAHYDHMGQGPDGTYWAGANDNASGVAALLEIARSWDEQGYVPRRTVVFAAWDAEEWGLVGSTTYVFHPSYPLENTVASIQMDMIGAGSDTLNIGGNTGLSTQLHSVAEELDIESEITTLGRSDHIPFMEAGIPASLLIWLSEDEVIPHYHRPIDQPAVIESEKLEAASKVASITLLDLVESEPAILSMLSTRAGAALENDPALFLSTSRQDQTVSDETWLADLQGFAPSVVNITVNDMEINGEMAVGDARIWIQYPNPQDSSTNQIISVDLPVQFSREGSEWVWAGPSLVMAEQFGGEEDSDDRSFLAVTHPRDVDDNFWSVGVEAARQYAEIAEKLNQPTETDSRLSILPDSEAIRVSTALSLPGDEDSWVGPGLVKLAYREHISQTEAFSTAIARLILANAGINEAAAPWLWFGLPIALQAEIDLVNTQRQHIPALHRSFNADEIPTRDPGAWAAVEYMIELEGWDGLGRFVTELGRACQQDSCEGSSGQDAALQRVLGMDSAAFTSAWRDHWKTRLDMVQLGLNELLADRTSAVLANDQGSFMQTIYPGEPALASSEVNWFADLFQHPLDSFSLSAHPISLLPNGDVLAEVTMSFQLTGSGDESISITTLFKREGDGYLWAGPSMVTLAGSTVAFRYPEGHDDLASVLLAEAESIYAALAEELGVDSPEPITIELFDSNEDFRASIALSFPAADWIRGWSSDGTAIRLRKQPVSQPEDYRSEIATQLARQLLYQKGVQAEWLLKGVSAYLARPYDGGASVRRITRTFPELAEAITSENLLDLRKMPEDAQVNQETFMLAQSQSWETVRFLIETHGWGALVELLEEHGAGLELNEAMQETLGESAISFTESWAASYQAGHLPDDAIDQVSEFDSEAAFDHVSYLASDELAGRLAGTEGSDNAAQYIATNFEEYGLQPAGQISGTSFFQPFFITTTTWAQEPLFEVIGDSQPFKLRDEMLFAKATVGGSASVGGSATVTESSTITTSDPISTSDMISDTSIIEGELVWIGSSLVEEEDLSGSIMVAIASESVEQQVAQAVSMGADGLLLLGIKDDVDELYFKNPLTFESRAEIPVLELTLDGSLRFLEIWGHTYMELSQLEDVVPMERSARMGAQFEQPQSVQTSNVLGILPGSDPKLAQELIIVGAHYDHVGDDPAIKICSSTSASSEQVCETRPGERYSGENDDASGVGVMLELARMIQETGYQPKRTILFAAWGAQEYGRLGSRHFVMTPTIPLSQTLTMLQLDAVGGGNGFYPGIHGNSFRDALPLHHANIAAILLEEDIIFSESIYESDQQTFSQAGIPVLLLSWRLADENNLPDAHAIGVIPERLASSGSLAALTLMMLAQ